MSLFPKNHIILDNYKEFFLTFAKVKEKEMAKKKILFINQEISPYVPDSDMSLMGQALPQAMQEKGHEIRTFMPKWGNINERRGQLHEVQRLSGMNLIINDTDHPLIIKVASIQSARIQIYFIDNDDYFSKRQMASDETGEDYPDNGERAIFFARGVLETVKKLRWVPDIIHCQGWMSAVVPLYIKTAYQNEPSFANTKVVTSLFSKSLKKNLEPNFKSCLEFRDTKADMLSAYNDNFDFEELGKLAIDYSDGIIKADKSISKSLLKYATSKNIPILDYHEEFADAYEAFYDQICPDEE
jgi:starch synthase